MLKIRALVYGAIAGSLITAFPLFNSLANAAAISSNSSNVVTSKTTSANGLGISPALNNLTAVPGQSVLQFKETVKNLANYSVLVKISVQDFGALNSNGTIGFFGANYNPSSNPHSLVNAISFASNQFDLKPYASQTIAVNINNPDSLSPGGHYSAILFTPELLQANNLPNKVSLQPSVAALVFLSTSTGGTPSLSLTNLTVGSIRFTLPTTVFALLTNNGNVQVVPRGYVQMYGPTNNLIAQTDINTNSGLILPGTSRLFMAQLSPPSNLFQLPGFYKVQIHYRYDGSSQYLSSTIRFFYFSPYLILYVFVIGLVVYVYLKINKNRKLRALGKIPKKFK